MLAQNWIVVVLVFVLSTVFGFPRPQDKGKTCSWIFHFSFL